MEGLQPSLTISLTGTKEESGDVPISMWVPQQRHPRQGSSRLLLCSALCSKHTTRSWAFHWMEKMKQARERARCTWERAGAAAWKRTINGDDGINNLHKALYPWQLCYPSCLLYERALTGLSCAIPAGACHRENAPACCGIYLLSNVLLLSSPSSPKTALRASQATKASPSSSPWTKTWGSWWCWRCTWRDLPCGGTCGIECRPWSPGAAARWSRSSPWAGSASKTARRRRGTALWSERHLKFWPLQSLLIMQTLKGIKVNTRGRVTPLCHYESACQQHCPINTKV